VAGEKVAIVTAGGSGMGAGDARRLEADRLKVAILSPSRPGEALRKCRKARQRWQNMQRCSAS
jgi:NAD(P)-dependent dehydrogenase (short-subunit alcohol dehydrogenase family)